MVGLDGKLSPENCGAALDTISALCQAKGTHLIYIYIYIYKVYILPLTGPKPPSPDPFRPCLVNGQSPAPPLTPSFSLISVMSPAPAPSPEEGVDILTNAATQILEACEAALRAFIVDRKATPIVLARLERATFLTGIYYQYTCGAPVRQEILRMRIGFACPVDSTGTGTLVGWTF